jgi:hypothetical protein
VTAQHVLGLDAHGIARDLGGDVRIAVAVAADPRAPVEEGPDARWTSAGSAGVACRRVGAFGARRTPSPVDGAVEGRIERAIHARRDRVQRLVEERHRRAHLVERRGRVATQAGGVPQPGDLLAEPATDVDIVCGREPRIIQPVEEPVAAPERDEQRPPAGLGRMRREHERDREAFHQVGRARRRPVVAAELVDGGRDGARHDAARRRARAPIEPPHALLLLGEIRQLEVQAEGPGQQVGLVEGDGAEDRVEPPPLERPALGAERDGRTAKPLHDAEQLRAALFHDDLPEQRAEQLDLPRERIAGAGRADAARLGAHGRVRGRAAPCGCLALGRHVPPLRSSRGA